MQKHRIPPKPIYYDNASPGQCRYCGDLILAPNGKLKVRANWHPHCLEEYKTIYWPQHTRKVIWKRDAGICALCENHCGTLKGGKWQVDHVRPLYEAQGRLEYWKKGNLQILCTPCHNAKSAIEAAERAAARKAK